jgi:TonB family protein
VSVVVEFTVPPEGRAAQVIVVESDADGYAREFSEQAVQAMATVRFHEIQMSCRGRMKIAFRIAGQGGGLQT